MASLTHVSRFLYYLYQGLHISGLEALVVVSRQYAILTKIILWQTVNPAVPSTNSIRKVVSGRPNGFYPVHQMSQFIIWAVAQTLNMSNNLNLHHLIVKEAWGIVGGITTSNK